MFTWAILLKESLARTNFFLEIRYLGDSGMKKLVTQVTKDIKKRTQRRGNQFLEMNLK